MTNKQAAAALRSAASALEHGRYSTALRKVQRTAEMFGLMTLEQAKKHAKCKLCGHPAGVTLCKKCWAGVDEIVKDSMNAKQNAERTGRALDAAYAQYVHDSKLPNAGEGEDDHAND
jgi:hypothetical protein